jgi:hypothetical protein
MFGALPGGKIRYMDAMNGVKGLSEILGELSYPAQKWQITACAEIYGAGAGIDDHIRRELYGLPVRTYESADDIVNALTSLRADAGEPHVTVD